MLERNHQVRREQLALYHDKHPRDNLRKSLRITCEARNWLRGVKGYSPLQRVLGVCPSLPGAIADEEFKLGEASAAQDEVSEFAKNTQWRADAAQALMQASVSRSVRAAMPADRDRSGETVRAGRMAILAQFPSGANLEKRHWRGPAMVSQLEYRDNPESEQPNIVWLAHGSALLWCTHENLRLEYPADHAQREQMQPDTTIDPGGDVRPHPEGDGQGPRTRALQRPHRRDSADCRQRLRGAHARRRGRADAAGQRRHGGAGAAC